LKTSAKLVGFLMTLSFLVFVWLSHTGVLPGTGVAHFWAGLGLLVVALAGLILLFSSEVDNDKLIRPLLFISGFGYVVNAIAYVILRSADLIGPRFYESSPSDVLFGSWVLGLIYLILAVVGAVLMWTAQE